MQRSIGFANDRRFKIQAVKKKTDLLARENLFDSVFWDGAGGDVSGADCFTTG